MDIELRKYRKYRKVVSKNNGTKKQVLYCDEIKCPSSYADDLKLPPSVTRISISNCLFKNNYINGLIITRPGVYKFKNNLKFNPTQPGTTAITINSSNVVLDLGIYSLKLGNGTYPTYGISICRDVHNVSIIGTKNEAQIIDFTLAGIRVFGRTDDILIKNVIITQTEVFQLTNEQIPENCSEVICTPVRLGIAIGEGDTGHLSMKGTDRNNLVKDVTLQSVICKRVSIGCQMVFTFGIKVDNCLFTENSYYGLLFGNSWTISKEDNPEELEFPISGNGVITNSHFDANVADTGTLANPGETYNFDFLSGISIYRSQNFVFNECTVHDNRNTSFILAVDHDGSHNIIWKNSTFMRNISDEFVCDGFHWSGSVDYTIGPCTTGVDYPFTQDVNILIENCSSLDNFGGITCSGFRFAFGDGARIKNCTASGNNSGAPSIPQNPQGNVRKVKDEPEPEPDPNYGCGFRFQGELPGGVTTANVMENCVAVRNGTSGGNYNAGIIISQGVNNLQIKNCNINDNGGTSTPSGPFNNIVSGGIITRISFQDEGTINGVIIDGCTIISNGSENAQVSGGIIIGNDAFGVLDYNVDHILIQNCTITYNKGDGINVDYPIPHVIVKNNEIDENTLIGLRIGENVGAVVLKNLAILNNPNYEGVSTNSIIEATQETLPENVGLKNVSITV